MEEAVQLSCDSDTKSTYSPYSITFPVFLSTCAARSPELEDEVDSNW